MFTPPRGACLLLAALLSLVSPRGGLGQEGVGELRAGDTLTVVYWPGDSLRAEEVLRSVRSFPPLPGLPDSVPSGATLYLAPDRPTLDSLSRGAVPEWGAGVAVPGRRRIILPAFASNRTRGWRPERVLRHEWAHLGLHQHLDGLRAPRWLDEGYAEWASGGWEATEAWKLRVALATGGAPPLDSLTLGWPRDRASAELAYLLSATAVEYLVRESGERGLGLFFHRWRQERSFEAALRGTYGVTSAQFEEDWRQYVKSRYGWLLVLSNSVVMWGVLGTLLLVLFLIRRRRDREHMARLRATEPPERPRYWSIGAEDGSLEEADDSRTTLTDKEETGA